MEEMNVGDFVSGLWSGKSTHMMDEDTGHTNDGDGVHSRDNAFPSCPGCVQEGWAG